LSGAAWARSGARRRYLAGSEAIGAALASREPVRVLLFDRDDTREQTTQLVAQAEAAGVALWRGSGGDLRRMMRDEQVPDAIAMLGPRPDVDLDTLLARRGAVWLLHRSAYPSNVGYAVRTAEVSGAEGVVVDADFNHEQRSRVSHVSMGADHVMPVLWQSSERVIEGARALGYRIVALEDVGREAPWEAQLTGPLVLVVGNEREGLPRSLLDRCDSVIAVPMAGFVPSYNVQAALSIVAAERLRQLEAGR
jgi:23S rRNA (guanosine2251-2'-O)-methyltransferase